jgi:hypothetical protein
VWSDVPGRRYYWRHGGRPLFGWARLDDLLLGPCPVTPLCPAVAVVAVNGPPLPMSEKVNDYLKAFFVGHGRRAVRGGGMTTEGLPCGPPFVLTCLYEELKGWAPELAAIVARGGTGRHRTPAADRAFKAWLGVAERLTPEETLFRRGGANVVKSKEEAIERRRRLDREAKRRRKAARLAAECAPWRVPLLAHLQALLDAADEREGLLGSDSSTSREDPWGGTS